MYVRACRTAQVILLLCLVAAALGVLETLQNTALAWALASAVSLVGAAVYLSRGPDVVTVEEAAALL